MLLFTFLLTFAFSFSRLHFGNKSYAGVRADPLLADELNTFYGRFECNGSSATLPISASGSSRQSSDNHVITVSEDEVRSRGLHRSKNSYPNPKRPVNVLHGTEPDPYFIESGTPNPKCRPEKCLKCTTRTRPLFESWTRTRLGRHRSDCTRSAHIAQQMLLSQ